MWFKKKTMAIANLFNHLSLSAKIRALLLSTLIPMVLMVTVLLSALIMNSNKYDQIVKNLTIASEFSYDFKNKLDYKAYQYIIVKKDFESFGMLEEIEQARNVVVRLQQTATHADSLKRLSTINKDLDKLELGIVELRDNNGYDFLMSRLDNNVRVLTDLIREGIWDYIYNETVILDGLVGRTNAEVTRIVIILAIVTFGLVVLLYFLSMRISSSITKPIKELCNSIHMVGEGDFTVRTVASQADEMQTMSLAFDSMVERIATLMDNVRNEQDNLRLAEFRLLQAQINPHFLYNTLDTVVWLAADKQNEQVIRIINSLSNFFRTGLNNGRDIITIREEGLHVSSYLEIQQIRYRDLLTYDIDIPEQLHEYTIPKLTLQPLVENALYHGLKQKRSLGKIVLSARQDDDTLCLRVWDNGIGIPPELLQQLRRNLSEHDKNSFGLFNVNQRLKLYYGSECCMDINSLYGEYTEIAIYIPTKKNKLLPEENKPIV